MQTRATLLTLFLLCSALNVYFRLYQAWLPSVRAVAQKQVEDEAKENLNREITAREYALPLALRRGRLEGEFRDYMLAHRESVERQVGERERERKAYMLDDGGWPYLLENDSFRWMRRVRTRLAGRAGEYEIDHLMRYPLGHPVEPMRLHYLLGAGFYRLMQVFVPSISLAHALAVLPVVFSVLMVAAVFLLGRTVGLSAPACAVAGLIIGLARTVLERTQLGWYDTDMYNVTVPLLIAALLARAMAGRTIFAFFAGSLAGVYSGLWSHWWVPVHILTAGAAAYCAGERFFKSAKSPSPTPTSGAPAGGHAPMYALAVFVAAHILSTAVISGPSAVCRMFWEPFVDIATRFGNTLDGFWPSVASSVGEIRMADLGFFRTETGSVLVFIAGALGLLLTLLHTRIVHTRIASWVAGGWVLMVWFAAALLLTIGSRRFMVFLMVPVGVGCGLLLDTLRSMRDRRRPNPQRASLGTVIFSAGLFLAAAAVPVYNIHSSRFDACIKFNDAWARMMEYIRIGVPPDAVVAADWPPGDFIMTLGERATLQCAGWQYTPVPYWFARAMMTDDERESANILRMLASVGTRAFDEALRLSGGDKLAALASLNRTLKEGAFHPRAPVYLLVSANGLTGVRNLQKLAGWDFRARAFPPDAGIIAPSFDGADYDLGGKHYLLFKNGLLIDRQTSAPLVTDAATGEWSPAPIRVIMAGEGAGLPRDERGNVPEHTAIITRDGGVLRAVVMNSVFVPSMLVRLSLFEGEGLRHFELVHEENYPRFNDRLLLYKVTWDD